MSEDAFSTKSASGSSSAASNAHAKPTLIPAAIKGTHDILPGEVEKWQALEALVRSTFEVYGFRELRAPVFEATELYEKSTGETSDVVTKEMYTFTDKGGRSLTLRPEYTPSVVRAIIEHRLDLEGAPMRYYFTGPMFRYDKPQKGRYRQFHQIDIEVFGEKDAAVDAEIIEMAHALLGKLGVTGTATLINSVGCRACRPAYSAALRQAAAARKDELCADCQRKAETNPLRIFDCKVDACQEVAKSFPSIQDYLCEECREHFAKLKASLDTLKVAYRVEPRLVRGLDYYTKTTFEIVTSHLGAQNAILGGGRYDDMMKDFGGPDICGTGFAMGMERVLSVAEVGARPHKVLYLAYLGDEAKKAGLELAGYFRSKGIECLVEYKDRGMKAHLGRANKLGAAWVLIVGENELKSGRFGLKDMATGRQIEGPRDYLLALILEG